MADSIGSAFKASNFGTKTKKRKGKQESPLDSAESKEARILLYMSRVCENVEGDSSPRKLGVNGRPINVFTGVEYTAEEMEVVEIEVEDE